MNVTDALYRAAHGYQHGGIDALAVRMGISASSLQHKVSPTYPGAHCSPLEVKQICEFTGDHSALQAMAAHLGYIQLRVPQTDESDGFSAELAATVREFGQFIGEVATDPADGQVTDNELRRIETEGAQALAAMQHLIALAGRLNQAAKPAALRTVKAA